MKNLMLLFSKFLPEWILLLCVLLSLNLLNNYSGRHQTVFFDTLGSVGAGMYELRNGISQYIDLPTENKRLQDENQRLKNKLEKLSVELSQLPDTIVQGDTGEIILVYHASEIINSTISQRHNYFILNSGEDDGLKEGVAVVADYGLVGIVTHVTPSFSLVLPVLNEKFQASAEIKNKGYFGILKWQGGLANKMLLTDVASYATVEIGDTVISRGGGVYPRNIPLGIVEDIERSPGANYLNISMSLFTDFAKLRYVYWVENIHQNELDSLQVKGENL